MDEGAKRRLVGAAVLVALAVIFVPMLLDDKDADGLGEPIVIPNEPAFDAASDEPGAPSDSDLTPLLPTPESPSGVVANGLDSLDGPAPLPTPAPPQQETTRPPVAPGPRPKARSDPKPTAEPAPAQVRAAPTGPKPIPTGAAAWVVQVASLGSSGAAGKLRDELRAKGYSAFVEQANVNGRLYYRVRVGPETDRGTADSAAAKLQRETGNKPLVQRYQ